MFRWMIGVVLALALIAGVAGATEADDAVDGESDEGEEYVDLTDLSFARSNLLGVIVASSPSLSLE